MALAPPPLPTQFPCWCRAVYSWGGESKRDLGFMEGDLIECLNAGDGSWWTGRLFRDRRTIGSFPSNFVEVLPRDFRPSRSVSPLPQTNTPSPKNTPQKSKTFRKPFEAYAKAPHYTTAKQPEVYREVPKQRQREEPNNSSASHGRNDSLSRARSPIPVHRAHSPAPPVHSLSRAHSPAPPARQESVVRGYSPAPLRAHSPRPVSPVPSFINHYHPQRMQDAPPPPDQMMSSNSPPPPAPPPHRHVARQGSNASYNPQQQQYPCDISRQGSGASYGSYLPQRTGFVRDDSHDYTQDLSRHGSHSSFNPIRPDFPHQNPPATPRHGSRSSFDNRPHELQISRGQSPCPSPGGSHMTPSPLREAMDGIIEQLDALGGHRAPSPQPKMDPWSPDSFDLVSDRSRRRGLASRPQTSMGLSQKDEGYETWSGSSSQDTGYQNSSGKEDKPLPELSNYVDRMEKRFQKMHQHTASLSMQADDRPPAPLKTMTMPVESTNTVLESPADRKLRHRKSAYEVGRSMLGRTFTTKTNATNTSSGNRSTVTTTTQSSDRSLMSGASAGGFSATSAGSLARRQERARSALGVRDEDLDRPETPFTGVTYHSSHASDAPRSKSQAGFYDDQGGSLGGLVQPKAPKRNIFKKIFDTAKTGVASGRSSIASGGEAVRSSPLTRSGNNARPTSVASNLRAMGSTPHLGSTFGRDAAREMGLHNGVDWVQVRRDVNRSNSLSGIEKTERRERAQMLDHPAIASVEELYCSIDGDEGADGMPVADPINFQAINLSQVDKNSRFLDNLPPMTTAITLATTYVCRPYRSDVQRLRAIFTWVAEKICWEEDFEGDVDSRRVIQGKRGCSEEIAVLVLEMCAAVGIQCEVVRGYLKTPGEIPDPGIMPRPNHWWNAVVVDNEWRVMDCCLANPSNPRRGQYSSVGGSMADPWWFLTRPSEICWTHIPERHEQQHMCPPVAHDVLLTLPCACPPFFRNELEMHDYNSAITRIEDLEMVHVQFNVPPDVEIAAEVEARAFTRDSDGDLFESGETVKKRALAQAEWFNGIKRYTVKALLPGDEGQGILKVYAGKRGLMHSIKDIPHPLAFALPIIHTGENPAYDFAMRHPTPHAQRHDIYVVQPQCYRLALNNTFVFAIRQHPSSVPGSVLTPASNPGGTSPVPFARPGSAMSMTASSISGSNPSSTNGSSYGSKKPAKLAIQTPGGKILRLMRKEDRKGISVGARLGQNGEPSDGGTWETIIKCSERGTWRGLVLADRTARWCVFAEWVCVG